MESLRRQRGFIKSSLTNFIKHLDDFSKITDISPTDIIELKERTDGIEGIFLQKFSDIQIQIESTCDSEDLEKEYKERNDFENKYYSKIAIAKEYLHRHEQIDLQNDISDNGSQSSQQRSNISSKYCAGQNIKLPDINLPTFDGSLQNWLEFRDVFQSLINKNESISDIQRFHYLRASLKNEPAQIISTLEFSSKNYNVAWELLAKRYNNDKMLIHNHIKNIFNIEPVSKESSKGLRNILNELTKNLRALSQVGLPISEWDVPIIYLVSTKLDRVTAREWESYKSRSNNFPTLHDLKTFLNSKAELLDTLEQNRGDKCAEKTHGSGTRGLVLLDSGVSNLNSNSESKIPKCVFCKGEHYIQACPNFLKIPTENRGKKKIL